MGFRTYLYKNVLMGFFVAVPCICAVMAVLGMVFEPEARFGYKGLLSPLIWGAATMLPTLVGYSKRELSVREAIIRKLIQLVLVEIIVLSAVYSGGGLTSFPLAVSLAFSVFLVGVAVYFVLWVNDRKTAAAFNKALAEMQEGHLKRE